MTAAAPATPTVQRPPRVPWIIALYRSAIVKKAVMAVTGIFLFGWILLHMLGNLKVYLGPEHYNAYAQFLITMGAPLLPNKTALVIVRTLLIIAAILHIVAATQLTIMNRKARPIGYREREYVAGSYAARTMRWGGVIILLFVFYHLGHLTFGKFHPDFIEGDVYHNFVTGFQVWWVSAFYIIANLALGTHLYHGLWSMFNSLGLNHPGFNPWKRVFATTFAIVVTAGNVSFPIAVLIGILR
ncbi:MAG TPA: succinate dehydrogenase cytochrome b subunit [Thermoanaerobaculia bacterium]|jgi:succinate dehydrogenase / fumarate reductase cytochrome b subunit|nr:succinate dehydrogenase cytochrome b subunit [Thermoanaerobaculia bacterium]